MTRFVFGTVCTVNLYEKGSEALYNRVFDRLQTIEEVLSANLDSSNISEINNAAGISPVRAAPETMYVLQRAIEFSKKSGGAFDPSIGAVTKLWSIGFEEETVPDNTVLREKTALVDYRDIIINDDEQTVFLARPGMRLDLGGIAKGYAADEAAALLVSSGIKKAIIDLGGNILALGEKDGHTPWTIGIRNPEWGSRTAVFTIPVINKSVVTSGIYERFFEEDGVHYHHILDPATGYPVDNELLSVTIITPVSLDADALSTAAFVLGPEKGFHLIESLSGAEAVFINRDREIRITPGLSGTIQMLDSSFTLAE
ncbi:FAD:protein FMN transferase [Brucepastera parasyntrophica]|uniref:FAD:protein FMN transferase n=1 Tax=Brucepastera parasyntrophica TaxID=2880008 RepID=UPI00210EE4F8|nr:FAD:protein FMN transferase [Brucepastera parasyntrophica]ULQ58583.1 FAD:protein FMN transferase [Brucepastera parasyntrophica]